MTPGIDAHTHKYIKTGQIDSKFGFALTNGDFYMAVEKLKNYKNVKLIGIHAHIGSQIFEVEPYEEEVDVMLNLVKTLKEEYNVEIKEVDFGGGIGVYYTEHDKPRTIQEFCEKIIKKCDEKCRELKIDTPTLILEPGRSLVANAGSTLYSIGSIKEIKDVRTYVSVDGGMTDNIRPSLYQAGYECAIVDKMNNEKTSHKVTIAGKCCESGDILILITTSTGAYGYSMASNYNKIPKNPVVFVSNGEDKLVCKRQSYEDLLSLEL